MVVNHLFSLSITVSLNAIPMLPSLFVIQSVVVTRLSLLSSSIRAFVMVPQQGIKLAVYLVASYFGDLNAKVCDCLLRRGTLTLANIIMFTDLSGVNVKNCLLVLIHHNCVQAFAVQEDGAMGKLPKVTTKYMALFDNIIHHMRFPKFIEIVSNELGKECEEIFEGLLQHGRLSLNQILDRIKQTANQGNSAEDSVQDNFHKLVQARFVERCPAPEPFLAPPAEEKSSTKRSSKTFKVLETIEQLALAAAAPLESMRFLVDDTWTNPSEEKDEETSHGVTIGQKRKLDSIESDDVSLLADGKKEILWRVNFEEFVRCLRHKACVENIRRRMNVEAGIVLEAILELSRKSEAKVKTVNTVPLSVNAIYDQVIKKEAGLGMNLESTRAALGQLGCEDAMLGTDDSFSIDLKTIIEIAQNEEVESIVLKRYGREAYRMFRLLSRAEHLIETDKIADTTFVEKKDTLKLLYRLWTDNYLQMQKVNVPGAKQSEFLLWKVNKQPLWENVLDEMYHAALNLRLRIAHEQEQEKEILQIPKERLIGELGNRYKRLVKVRIILESSLMNLDGAILLFHEF
ncbi:DNA-directed RNA polymerase [Lithospermum erythrorhizon]|uniref:DNA-directed RNA polymerase III subunit RPC3 n=1 Tax=Lithospermum erythrorhizon TaxID=34254 RepID=A0AAV3Q721_LITER